MSDLNKTPFVLNQDGNVEYNGKEIRPADAIQMMNSLHLNLHDLEKTIECSHVKKLRDLVSHVRNQLHNFDPPLEIRHGDSHEVQNIQFKTGVLHGKLLECINKNLHDMEIDMRHCGSEPKPTTKDINLELRAMQKITADDMLSIALGCFDYSGGYRSDEDKLEIFHHGIQTVVNSLQSAIGKSKDGLSLQTKVLKNLGEKDKDLPFPNVDDNVSGEINVDFDGLIETLFDAFIAELKLNDTKTFYEAYDLNPGCNDKYAGSDSEKRLALLTAKHKKLFCGEEETEDWPEFNA